MKKIGIFFAVTAGIALLCSFLGKKRENSFLALTAKLLGGTAVCLGKRLKRRIAVRSILSFLGVTLLSAVCKKAV